MKIYESKEQCSGCRACEQICPMHCIQMISDEEGFWYPMIEKEKCIQCGACKRACTKKVDNFEAKHDTYAVINKDSEIRRKSSSGGMFYEIAKKVLAGGGIVYGASFDENFQVCQKAIDDMGQIEELMGAKYVQSDTKDTYKAVREHLRNGRDVLYSGTPCQITGLKKFLGKESDKLICVAVICLGVPSPEVWRRYLLYRRGEFAAETVYGISFRDKVEGWKNYHLIMNFNNAQRDVSMSEDLFGKAFVQGLFLRPSCYACSSKGDNNLADIIIGDYWGIEKVHPHMDDRCGTSIVIVNTEKGQELFRDIEENFEVEVSRYEYAQKYNQALIKSANRNPERKKFFAILDETNSIAESLEACLKKEIDTESRKSLYYPLVKRYLKKRLKGWSICDFLKSLNLKRVTLYAITEFTELIIDDIRWGGSSVETLILCDSNAQNYATGYEGYHVIDAVQLQDLYQKNEIDCVVVCSLLHENVIIEDLMRRGISQNDIFSLASILYG